MKELSEGQSQKDSNPATYRLSTPPLAPSCLPLPLPEGVSAGSLAHSLSAQVALLSVSGYHFAMPSANHRLTDGRNHPRQPQGIHDLLPAGRLRVPSRPWS